MGHSSFAYIVRVRSNDAWDLQQAVERLREDPPSTGPEAYTDFEGYTIRDNFSLRILPRPSHLSSQGLERLARAIIRNLSAPRPDFPENPWRPREWDDAEARRFLFENAGKWMPVVVMPIDATRAFVFGMAGG